MTRWLLAPLLTLSGCFERPTGDEVLLVQGHYVTVGDGGIGCGDVSLTDYEVADGTTRFGQAMWLSISHPDGFLDVGEGSTFVVGGQRFFVESVGHEFIWHGVATIRPIGPAIRTIGSSR